MVEPHKRTARQTIHLLIIPGPRAMRRPFEICRLTNLLPLFRGQQHKQQNRQTASTLGAHCVARGKPIRPRQKQLSVCRALLRHACAP
jgi:hypothetical protein